MLKVYNNTRNITDIFNSFRTFDINLDNSDNMMIRFIELLDVTSGEKIIFITKSMNYLIFKDEKNSSDIARISTWDGKYIIEIPKNDDFFDRGLTEVPYEYSFSIKQSTEDINQAIETIMKLV